MEMQHVHQINTSMVVYQIDQEFHGGSDSIQTIEEEDSGAI